MSPRPIRNVSASVKQRLLNLAKKQGRDFNFLLSRFAAERLLFRLSLSDHGKGFVLKGAMLFHLRSTATPHRSTHDLDLMGRGTPDPGRIAGIFKEVCRIQAPDDGLLFPEGQVRTEPIKTDDEYLGVRVRLESRMGSARIPLQVDIGFGDVVIPTPERETLATLLDLPSPVLPVYPWEAVIAEKFNAMVELGMGNSRMKDYFDLHHLSSTHSFEGETLGRAIRAVFEGRHTPLPSKPPEGLCPGFGTDPVKREQWRAFLKKMRLEDEPRLADVITKLVGFLMPPVEAALKGVPFARTWSPGGPWREG